MINFLKRLFLGRDLRSALNNTKKIRVKGVRFVIRKLDPLDSLQRARIMTKGYDVKELPKDPTDVNLIGSQAAPVKAIKSHFREVFLCSVVHPHLLPKEGDNGVWVDELFADWELASELYMEIMSHTYGKKKVMAELQALSS